MLKYISILVFIVLSMNCIAQKTVESNGEYTLRIEKNWTEDFAVNKAKENAKINAIENAFGSVVTQGNAVYVKDITTGNKTQSDMVFTSIADILVNGEWIATIDEKVTFTESEGFRFVTAKVKGKVRELTKIPFTPEVATLSCNEKKCATEVFNSGQQLIVYFKAPTNGFVTVYLDDSKQAQRLLPYSKNNATTTFEVKADQVYFFFSKADAKQKNIDEVELFTESTMEQNNLYVLFSKYDFDKPLLNATSFQEVDHLKYTLPASMEITKFQTWLQGIRSYNRNIELKTILLTIKK
ncbi:MAG: hypothetical protein ACOYMA_12755 [Bacteroidia bacterium]